jgi:hypothetical protein
VLRSLNNFIKRAGFNPMKLLRQKFREYFVDLARAASQLGVEIVLDEIVSAR